ncbi:MAG TPA: precorrin-3B C(17)-methyltransferase [Polyangiaceae bacterium]|nr:precorrin-3B C(17)-methyltransferase [Polyangiaceae bacterium]
MAFVTRLAGAIVIVTEVDGGPAFYVVGDTKVPCDWAVHGFLRPEARERSAVRYERLLPVGAVVLEPSAFAIELEGESAARLIADRMLVARNGSVSERLWRLVTGQADGDAPIASERGTNLARWIHEMPLDVWNVVRDSVLRCV